MACVWYLGGPNPYVECLIKKTRLEYSKTIPHPSVRIVPSPWTWTSTSMRQDSDALGSGCGDAGMRGCGGGGSLGTGPGMGVQEALAPGGTRRIRVDEIAPGARRPVRGRVMGGKQKEAGYAVDQSTMGRRKHVRERPPQVNKKKMDCH